MSAQPSLKSRRFRLRINLRGLMLLVLLSGGATGWIVHVARSAQGQRLAVAGIRRAGGWVLYDWDFKHGRFRAKNERWGPTRLVDLIGVDYFGHVAWVYLPRSATDNDLAYVGQLGRVEWLGDLTNWLTDAGLVHLSGLANLRELNLRRTQVTDPGLAHLKGLTRLSKLDLSRTQVTDAGLKHLQALTGLGELYLQGTQVSDAGLKHLEGLTGLRELHLQDTLVSDAGVRELQQALPRVMIWR